MLRIKKCIGLSIFLTFAILASGALKSGIPQEPKIELNALISETQKSSDKPNAMIMIWWIPEEFWLASAAQDPSFTDAQAQEIIKILQPYTIIAVVDGTVGSFGGVTYNPESSIRSNIVLIGTDGLSYRPLSSQTIGADAKNLISMLKPVIANMLGEMGQNFHFFLFPAKDKQGANIAQANKDGIIRIQLRNEEYRWRLPLSSLLPAITCPQCGEKCSGAWEYCPWCGTKLIKTKK